MIRFSCMRKFGSLYADLYIHCDQHATWKKYKSSTCKVVFCQRPIFCFTLLTLERMDHFTGRLKFEKSENLLSELCFCQRNNKAWKWVGSSFLHLYSTELYVDVRKHTCSRDIHTNAWQESIVSIATLWCSITLTLNKACLVVTSVCLCFSFLNHK